MRKKQVDHLLTVSACRVYVKSVNREVGTHISSLCVWWLWWQLDESTAEYRDLFLETLMGGPVDAEEPVEAASAQGQVQDGPVQGHEAVGMGDGESVLPEAATGIDVSA